jgi:hypothetical protein
MFGPLAGGDPVQNPTAIVADWIGSGIIHAKTRKSSKTAPRRPKDFARLRMLTALRVIAEGFLYSIVR